MNKAFARSLPPRPSINNIKRDAERKPTEKGNNATTIAEKSQSVKATVRSNITRNQPKSIYYMYFESLAKDLRYPEAKLVSRKGFARSPPR